MGRSIGMKILRKLKKGTGVALVCIAAASLLFSVGADAQEFLKKYAPPMPEMPLPSAEEFESKTILHEEVPGGDVALSCRFRLPKDWGRPDDTAQVSYVLSNKVFGELLRYYSPPMPDLRSHLAVQAINLEYRSTAHEWLIQYLLSNGYTVQGINIHDDKKAEALYVLVDKGLTYVVRSLAVMNGKRVVFAQYFVPSDLWDDEKVTQAQVINSFALSHPVEEEVEDLQLHHFLDVSEFKYPVSWEFKPQDLKSADRMSFELLRVASEEAREKKIFKTLHGKIQVDIISYFVTESIEVEKERFKQDLTKTGLLVGNLL